jgi:hypothetical protein
MGLVYGILIGPDFAFRTSKYNLSKTAFNFTIFRWVSLGKDRVPTFPAGSQRPAA